MDTFTKRTAVNELPPMATERSRNRARHTTARVRAIFQGAFFMALLGVWNYCYWTHSKIERVQRCSIENIHRNLSFLDSAGPINVREFISRRDSLAQALVASGTGVEAFIIEPGYTFQYHANVSQTDWEPWEPEERPFLMIIRPFRDPISSEIRANTSFLCPKFEEGRVRMLNIPASEELSIVTWEEHWDPYMTLREGTFGNQTGIKVMVDEEMRDFIVRGLSSGGFETVGLHEDVAAVRQTKTPAEVEILRAVNTGTVEAVRAMRKCLVPGLTENQVITILDNTLLSVGFSLFFDLVLFEENAALPHGGFVTGDKVLKEDTMVLIDVGAHYLGYSSDISRSFFIPPQPSVGLPLKSLNALLSPLRAFLKLGPAALDDGLHNEKLKVWDLVKLAQVEASKRFTPNHTTADVDMAARTIIREAGYGDMKHRVGHGIGIKAHEAPYLHLGSPQKLRPGMTFTDEPGVYLDGRFGVRHEDVFLVKDGGEAEILTGRLANGPYDP